MSVKDLTQGDFKFWQTYLQKDRTTHEREFMQVIDPTLLRCFYRGWRTKDYYNQIMSGNVQDAQRRKDTLTLTRIFTSTNTILPNLYYENPRILAIPQYGQSPIPAALLSSALNYYMVKLKQKEENQNAVMNAYFFGIGWKKVGYKVSYMNQQPGASSNFEQGAIPAIPYEETLVNTSESPENVLIDHKGTWRNFRVITHRIKRSLFDVENMYGDYPDAQEAVEEFRMKAERAAGSNYDSREHEEYVNEQMIEMRDGIYILTSIDGINKPLRFERIARCGEWAWSPLVFTNEPDARYPISHMRIGSQVQERIDNIATLQYEIIARMRNQIGIWEDSLAKGQKEAIERNKLGGIVLFNKPLSAGNFANIASQPVTADLTNLLQIAQNNLTEVMGANEQLITGQSKNKTLGQDQMAQLGTQIREGGNLDRVREWLIDQKRKEGRLLQKYSSASLQLKITPQDFHDAQVGQRYKPFVVPFMNEANPNPLSKYIGGEDGDDSMYDYTLNVYEAVKPDKKVLAQEYDEFMTIYTNPLVENALLERGFRPRLDLVARKRAETFEYIDGDSFMEQLDPMQQAAIQTTRLLQQAGGALPPSASQQMEMQAQKSAQDTAGKVREQKAKVEKEAVVQ